MHEENLDYTECYSGPASPQSQIRRARSELIENVREASKNILEQLDKNESWGGMGTTIEYENGEYIERGRIFKKKIPITQKSAAIKLCQGTISLWRDGIGLDINYRNIYLTEDGIFVFADRIAPLESFTDDSLKEILETLKQLTSTES